MKSSLDGNVISAHEAAALIGVGYVAVRRWMFQGYVPIGTGKAVKCDLDIGVPPLTRPGGNGPYVGLRSEVEEWAQKYWAAGPVDRRKA